MAEFETKSNSLCEYSKQLGLGDAICGALQTPASPVEIRKPETAPLPQLPKFNLDAISAVPTIKDSIAPQENLPKKSPWAQPDKAQPSTPNQERFQPPGTQQDRVQPNPRPSLPPFSVEPQPAPADRRLPPAQPDRAVPRPNPASGAIPTVYVDIGHCTSQDQGSGKQDHGFHSDEYTECQINKAVGKSVIRQLGSAGYRVVPTWNPDSPPPLVSKAEDLQRRNNVVNQDIARNGGDSIYISIHHDNDSSKESGQCVYIAQPKWNEAITLAKTIQNSAWQLRPRDNAPACINPDTKTQNGKLVGLRGVNTIGVLIEGANVQNQSDKQLMLRPEWQQQEAKSITQGVLNYFRLKAGSERPYPPNSR